MSHKRKFDPFVWLVILVLIVWGFYIWSQFAPRQFKRADILTPSFAATLIPTSADSLVLTQNEVYQARRNLAIERVRNLMTSYGSPLVPYAGIMVDRAKECGGDYRILVGIAGSESGLGRINYKKYNPFGYLNGVQYAGFEDAIYELSCKISQQHLAVCGNDLNCLVRRYAGPQDDAQLFINKVSWFARQV